MATTGTIENNVPTTKRRQPGSKATRGEPRPARSVPTRERKESRQRGSNAARGEPRPARSAPARERKKSRVSHKNV
jgi:hypothetical protein